MMQKQPCRWIVAGPFSLHCGAADQVLIKTRMAIHLEMNIVTNTVMSLLWQTANRRKKICKA